MIFNEVPNLFFSSGIEIENHVVLISIFDNVN